MKRRLSLLSGIGIAVAAICVSPQPDAISPAMAQQQPSSSPAGEELGGDSASQRIDQLELRIKDLQSVIGTLQSFVRDGGAVAGATALPAAEAAPDAGASGAPSELSIRVLALETQVRALTDQMKDILDRLDRNGAPAAGGPNPWRQGENAAGRAADSGGATFSSSPPEQPASSGQAAPPLPPAPQFGAVTSAPRQTAQLPAAPVPSGPPAGGARGIYESSYQSFVRNDMERAEQGFRNFLATYPDDPLATNAYYWLGRTHFERQQYEPAAKAFLDGYKRDKMGPVAPDSLLHLGISLAKLGEKDAACSTLGAVSRQYPDASQRLRDDAADAMKQARC